MKRLATLAALVLLAAMPFYGTRNQGRRAGALPSTSPAASPNTSPSSSRNTSQESYNPCPPPPAVVAGFLGLSEEQTAEFTRLLRSFQGAVGPLEQHIAILQHQLDTLLSQPSPDPAAIGLVSLQIHALQQQAAQAVESYQGQFVGLLTMDQKQKVQEVTLASQLQPVVGAFVSLYLAPPPTTLACPGQ